jgi:hypothetical protein
MYKKVTHSIVEEHFAHPMAQEIKKMVDVTAKTGAAWPPLPRPGQFYTQLRSQFSEFNTALRNIIVGSSANDPALDYNKQQLSTLTTAFGPFFEPYYGQSAAESVVGHIANFVKSIESMIAAAKNKGDWNSFVTQAKDHLDALAVLINSWNPAWWTNKYPSLATYLTQYAQAVSDQVSSRAIQNWSKDSADAELARYIVAAGPISGYPFNGAPDLSNQLASSIIQQFPDRFPL